MKTSETSRVVYTLGICNALSPVEAAGDALAGEGDVDIHRVTTKSLAKTSEGSSEDN